MLGPDGQALPAEGAFVEADSFWHRRLAKGEIERVAEGGKVRVSVVRRELEAVLRLQRRSPLFSEV